MSKENPFAQEQATPQELLQQLDQSWGGPLYYEILPEYIDQPLDISGKGLHAIMAEQQMAGLIDPKVNIHRSSANIITDFRNLVIAEMPFPQKATSNIHLLSNIFSRAVLTQRVDDFVKRCLLTPTDKNAEVIKDNLPYPLEFSQVLFSNPDWKDKSFFTLIAEAKQRALDYSAQFDFNNRESQQFVKDFREGLDTMAYVTNLNERQREQIHPMIVVATTHAQLFYEKNRNK